MGGEWGQNTWADGRKKILFFKDGYKQNRWDFDSSLIRVRREPKTFGRGGACRYNSLTVGQAPVSVSQRMVFLISEEISAAAGDNISGAMVYR